MNLIQILLFVNDNEGQHFEPDDFVQLRAELADRFGGVTTYMRAPARGLWKDDAGETTRDDIVIFEVMTDELDRSWWSDFRKDLERRFRQDSVIIRALTRTRL